MGLFTQLRKELDQVEAAVEDILSAYNPDRPELKKIANIKDPTAREDALKAFAEAKGFPVLKCPACGSYHYKATDETFETHQCDDCGQVWSKIPGGAFDGAAEAEHRAQVKRMYGNTGVNAA